MEVKTTYAGFSTIKDVSSELEESGDLPISLEIDGNFFLRIKLEDEFFIQDSKLTSALCEKMSCGEFGIFTQLVLDKEDVDELIECLKLFQSRMKYCR